jgi:hypothetical protein
MVRLFVQKQKRPARSLYYVQSRIAATGTLLRLAIINEAAPHEA